MGKSRKEINADYYQRTKGKQSAKRNAQNAVWRANNAEKNKKSVSKSHTKKFILTLADEDDLAFVSDLLEQRRKKDEEKRQ